MVGASWNRSNSKSNNLGPSTLATATQQQQQQRQVQRCFYVRLLLDLESIAIAILQYDLSSPWQ